MIAAYYAVHYGADYLGWSIKSIYDYVDKIYIIYTDTPSHGHGTRLICPDSREDMKAAAYLFGDPQNKIKWTEGHWSNEGMHRHAVDSLAKADDVDKLLVVDADEIWDADLVVRTLDSVGACSHNAIRMLTFWRSFSWVCTDDMMPIRVLCPKAPKATNYLDGRVNHFGYARRIKDIAYKMDIHGHKCEWRKEWFDKYKSWPASGNEDLHPTCNNIWNASPFDKTVLPYWMNEHPYYNLDVIE